MTHTPTIQIHAEKSGHNVSVHEDETTLPDGYTRLVIIDQAGHRMISPLTRDELSQVRDHIDNVLRGAR
jgi:hypothetical protein